jgi:spermidine synthase
MRSPVQSFTCALPSYTIALVKSFESLDEARAPDGTVMKLVRRGEEYVILADGAPLMSSRMHGSEDALATLTQEYWRSSPHPSVLIGGLGLGFTLRATLNLLPPHGTVVVSELVPAVVAWNRGVLGALAGHPLQDARTQVATEDVVATIRSSISRFDAVLLDVDNGPAAFTVATNSALYDERGVAAVHTALKRGGTLAVWATQDDAKFVQRLRRGGFETSVRRVRATSNRRGSRHIIFLAKKLR